MSSVWLQRFSWIPVLAILIGVVFSAYWSLDRTPPFRVESSRVVPPSVPGGPLWVEGKVWRDISRDCDLEVTHWVQDSRGFRHYLPSVQIPAESIRKLETEVSPGVTKFTSIVPISMTLGKATYHAENRYVCNPIHLIWPISVITHIDFEVTAK